MDEIEIDVKSATKPSLGKTMLAGMAVSVPFIITIVTLWWLGNKIESAVRDYVVPENVKLWPGLGFLIGLFLALSIFFVVGLLTRLYLVRKVVQMGEWIVLRIPLAKSLYEATRDLFRFFGGTDGRKLGRVVHVSLADGQFKMIGLLTNEHPHGAPITPLGETPRVAVWLPMSYQIGGFLIYVRPDQVSPCDLSVEQAMKITATADVG